MSVTLLRGTDWLGDKWCGRLTVDTVCSNLWIDVGYSLIKLRGYVHVCVFFFFQAEDGIRDYKVTGVQTCALPISRSFGGLVVSLVIPDDRGDVLEVRRLASALLPEPADGVQGPRRLLHRQVRIFPPGAESFARPRTASPPGRGSSVAAGRASSFPRSARSRSRS